MKRSLQAVVLGCLILLSACSKAPKHTRYIPADATFVVGLSTEELQKKVAWSTVSGSPMMQELLRNMGSENDRKAVTGLDKSGIEWMSTVYAFGRHDEGYPGNSQMVIVLPLKDSKAFEAYLKQLKPGMVVKTVKDRKETGDNEAYIAWNDDVALVSNTARGAGADAAATAADIDAIFSLSKDASMVDNKRFKDINAEKHDIVGLMNYEQLMNSNAGSMGMLGMGMAPLYKGSFVSFGFDFNKGQIDGAMKYFPSEEMREIAAKMGDKNIDEEMLNRLPGANLDGALAYHLSPEGLKLMLDKMNITAMVNGQLREDGLTIDDLLKATTGDIVLSVNNLSVRPVTESFEGLDGPQTYTHNEPDADGILAVKIGDRAALNKLLALLTKNGVQPSAPNTYTIPMSERQVITLTVGDKYLVASNRAPLVQGFIAGSNKPALADDAKKALGGHPSALFVDAQAIMAPLAAGQQGSDSLVFVEARNMLKRFTAQGGGFKDGATTYSMTLQMMNANENSLVQIVNFINRMVELDKQSRQEVAAR